MDWANLDKMLYHPMSVLVEINQLMVKWLDRVDSFYCNGDLKHSGKNGQALSDRASLYKLYNNHV